MEGMGDWEQRNLINELKHGRELAKQLQIQLNLQSNSTLETRETIVEKILGSYEKALSMLNYSSPVAGDHLPHAPSGSVVIRMSESPPSLSGSPQSEDSDRDLKDQDNRDVSRKRKTMPRWTQQVRVSPGVGLEGPLDDGFSWRKYGQKDILGAKYPRGYYRCTHRNVQGCLATKQVQKSDEDPTIFEITYRGRHTCTTPTHVSHILPPSNLPEKNSEPITSGLDAPPQYNPQPQPQKDLLLNFRTELKVITDGLNNSINEQPNIVPSFPSTASNILQADQNHVFPDNSYNMGHYSPSTFMSPATSGANYFSESAIGGVVNSYQGNQNFQHCDQSDHHLTEVISAAATSATNSPTLGLGFPFGNAEFDPNFSFDNPGFLS